MSVLDHPVVSGRYFFPQSRTVDSPFLVNVDGATLACFHRVAHRDALTMIHFHGNGECVADYVPEMAVQFEALGLNSLFVEYREYGASTGKAQLAAMLGDGASALEEAGIVPEKAIAFGRSIGSLYAIELIYRLPNVAGLILDSGIANPYERFMVHADLTGTGITDREVLAETARLFNHEQKSSGYQNPVLLLHTERDNIINITHAESNFAWSGSANKRLVRFPFGDHNSIFAWNQQQYMQEVREFVSRVAHR